MNLEAHKHQKWFTHNLMAHQCHQSVAFSFLILPLCPVGRLKTAWCPLLAKHGQNKTPWRYSHDAEAD